MSAVRTLLHLSDTHILTSDDQRLHGADTLSNLRRALDYFDTSAVPADAVVISGDLANHGDPLGYQRLRSVLDPWLARRAIPLVAAMGNHDQRAAFRQVMLGSPGDNPVDYVAWVGGLRIIALDCTVPGAVYGETRPEQLEWLRSELDSPAAEGTVLTFHHPPTIEPGALAHMVRLRGAEALEAVVRGTDVLAILAGHVHHTVAGAFAHTFCFTAPAIAYMVDPLALANGTLAPLPASGFALIRITNHQATAATIYVS